MGNPSNACTMGCCGGSSKVGTDESEHPPRTRATPCTTDLPWLLLFIAFLAFEVAYVALTAFEQGEPKRLYYGMDYLGNVCGLEADKQSNNVTRGVKLDLTKKPYWAMFSYRQYYTDAGIPTTTAPIGICVGYKDAGAAPEACPTVDGKGRQGEDRSWIVPLEYEKGNDGFATTKQVVDWIVDGTINATYLNDWVRPLIFDTKKESWGPYCGPDFGGDNPANASGAAVKTYNETQNSPTAKAKRSIGDIQAAANTIGICCIAALILGFVYVVLVSLFVKCIVWSAIVLAFVGLAGTGYYFSEAAKVMAAEGSEDADTYTYVGYAFYAIALIYLCVIIAIRRTIGKAICIVQYACKAIMDMKELVFWPIVPYALIIGSVGFFLVVWLNLISAGELGENSETGMREFSYNKTLEQYMWINLFALLWTMVFWGDFGNTVIAWCTSTWYFTPEPRDDKGEPLSPKKRAAWQSFPLCVAVKNTLLQSMGVIALGSLIVACVKFIRAVIMYMQRQAEASGNKVAVKLLQILQCCVYCIEKCMKYITENAYILHTIEGGNFCKNGLGVFKVLASEPTILALMEVVSVGVCLLGKIFVCAVTTVIGYYLLAQQKQKGEISGFWTPLIIVFILAWVIGAVFMAVYDMIMDTITVCHIQDISHCDTEYSPASLSEQVKQAKEAADEEGKVQEE